jgi:hypothetical protein
LLKKQEFTVLQYRRTRSGRSPAALPRPSKSAIKNSGWRFCFDYAVKSFGATKTKFRRSTQRVGVCGRERLMVKPVIGTVDDDAEALRAASVNQNVG